MNIPLVTKFAEDTKDEPLKKELLQLLQLGKTAAEKITKVLNEVFIKTSTIIKGVAPAKKATIKTLLADFETTAKARDITNIWIDKDIINWFDGVKISEKIAGDSRLLRFVKDITHTDIIDNAKQLNAYQEFDLSDAIQRATALVAVGELDEKNNRGVVIYLTNKRGETPCGLFVWRHVDGKLNLHVLKVGLGRRWSAGFGALVSNENLAE